MNAARPSVPPATEPDQVLEFWFGTPQQADTEPMRALWFAKDPAFDREIAERFGPLIERALRDELPDWAWEPGPALARVLLLDQFTRNAFRDTPRAFAGDALALRAARSMIEQGQDQQLRPLQRSFVYLPFEHAEGLAEQDEALRLFGALAEAAPGLAGNLEWAEKHRAIIARFGRFPHRNAILGRPSTPEELAFLQQPGSRF
jgi:uncharacterized protein (DUF924 family)